MYNNVQMRITRYIYTLNILRVLSAHFAAIPETPGQAPFSFTISVLGSFTCITQHTGPTALRPIRRMKQLVVKCLAHVTSIREKHILKSAYGINNIFKERNITQMMMIIIIIICGLI